MRTNLAAAEQQNTAHRTAQSLSASKLHAKTEVVRYTNIAGFVCPKSVLCFPFNREKLWSKTMRNTSAIRSAFAAVSSVTLGALVACSCSASGDGVRSGNGGDGNGSSGGSGSAANPIDGGDVSDGAVPHDGSYSDTNCLAGEYPGSMPPLDVYILLDVTGSMTTAPESGPAPWTNVKPALVNFLSSELAVGIGVGMTYMPVKPPEGFKVPGSCNKGILGIGAVPCDRGTCQSFSVVGGLGLDACLGACTAATVLADCGLYGPCVPMPPLGNFCSGALTKNVSCDPADYGEPVVPIAELPGNKDLLIAALKTPDGDATPTQPAMEGTYRFIKKWAQDNPSHLVNVLFATDGDPNDCTYNTINGAAEAADKAFKTAPPIPTFVIGIGKIDNLEKLAKAGGTTKAYLTSDGSDMGQQLVDVFNEIRKNGQCQFVIPTPQHGELLDYGAVNFYYTPLGSEENVAVGYVGSAELCDPVKGGWYYDDPLQVSPTKVILCPVTCDKVGLSTHVEIQLGCQTIIL